MKSHNAPKSRRGSDSLAAGFLAGAFGGLAFLTISLARDGADFLAYWPAAPFTFWLIVRSVAGEGTTFLIRLPSRAVGHGKQRGCG